MASSQKFEDERKRLEGLEQEERARRTLASGIKALTGTFGTLTLSAIGLSKAISSISASRLATQTALAPFSAPHAAAAGRLEAARIGRQIETGQATAQSFESLTNAVNSFERSTAKYQHFATNVGNLLMEKLTVIANAAVSGVKYTSLTAYLADKTVDKINEWMKGDGKAAAPYFKMLDDVHSKKFEHKPRKV